MADTNKLEDFFKTLSSYSSRSLAFLVRKSVKSLVSA
jgi:hypothetical protein